MIQVHLVKHHLSEYIEMEGMPMALFSEQTGEALHSNFQRHWQHYQVKDPDAPAYKENLLRAVVSYNSCHI